MPTFNKFLALERPGVWQEEDREGEHVQNQNYLFLFLAWGGVMTW